MENVREFYQEELKKISECELTENDRRHLNNCIRLFKNDGCQLQDMLDLTPTQTERDYIISKWDVISAF